MVLAVDAFVTVISGIYASILTGVETVDQERLSLKSLIRSKLFLFFTLSYVHSAITLPITYFALTTFAFHQPLLAALSVVTINTTVHLAMFIVLIVMVRQMFKVTVPWKSISRYALASAVMGTVLFLLPYSGEIFTILVWTAIGGAVYLALLMLIDKEARALPMSILHELRRKKKE